MWIRIQPNNIVSVYCIIIGIVISHLLGINASDVFQLTDASYESTVQQYDAMLVNFYADWCHFSRMLTPVYDEAAKKIADLTASKHAALGRIDCEEEKDLCQKFGVRKYPTIKVVRYGVISKQEYRRQRSSEAIEQFVRELSADSFKIVDAHGESGDRTIVRINDTKPIIGGIMDNLDPTVQPMLDFKKVAAINSESCNFYVIVNASSGGNRIVYREKLNAPELLSTALPQANLGVLNNWVLSYCTPAARQLTFENVEEITEEGLPLLLLFHRPGDEQLATQYSQLVRTHMTDERTKVNFVYADGHQFSHPLVHLGKSIEDLPLICIDSFAHMYIFPGKVTDAVSDPTHLRQFVADLQSGKLHREFHHGPDPVTPEPTPQAAAKKPAARDDGEEDGDDQPKSSGSQAGQGTQPPLSVFRKLAPSPIRYTLLHDEF